MTEDEFILLTWRISRKEEPEIIEAIHGALMKNRALVTARDEHGMTPFWTAANRNSPTVMRLLLDFGADPNACGNTYPWSRTPLAQALSGGRVDLVEFLLQHGADPNRVSAGTTPLQWIVYERNPLELLELMLKYGSDPLACSEDGETVLFGCKVELIPAYIKLGVDPNARDNAGKTALSSCVHRPAKFLALVGYGADPNVSDNEGRSILHILYADPDGGDARLVRRLVSIGVDPNAPDNEGLTPIHYAASILRVPGVKLLLKLGANLNAVDNSGRTPRKLVETGIYLGYSHYSGPDEPGDMTPEQFAEERAKMLKYLDSIGAK